MQFLLYCLCGGIGVLSDLSIYYFAIQQGVSYQIANALGYFVGTVISFALNRKITFSVHDHFSRRLILFIGVAGTGFLTSTIILLVLIDLYAVDARVAKIITLPVVVILQFSLNRWITFRENKTVS